MRPSIPCVLGAALLAVGCAAGPNPEAERSALMETDRAWAAAAQGADVDAIVAFWTEDATVVPPGAPPIRGREAIRRYVEESGAIPGFSITWTPEDVHVSPDGQLGYTSGTNRVTFQGPDGQLQAVDGRYLTVWRKDADGQWRCVYDIWNAAGE